MMDDGRRTKDQHFGRRWIAPENQDGQEETEANEVVQT